MTPLEVMLHGVAAAALVMLHCDAAPPDLAPRITNSEDVFEDVFADSGAVFLAYCVVAHFRLEADPPPPPPFGMWLC